MTKLFILLVVVVVIIGSLTVYEVKSAEVQSKFSFLNDKFVHKKAKRSLDNTDKEYLNFMQNLNWDALKESDLTMNVGGKNYQLSKDLIEKMETYHNSK